MPARPVEEHLRTFIVRTFPTARTRAIGLNEPLLESGILDSLGVLEVVGFLEREFEVVISDDDLVPENFGTLGRLTAFVIRKTPVGSGA